MNRHLDDYLTQVEFGDIQAFEGMGVLPVFRKGYDALEHLTLKEALEEGALLISEVSHAGSVPELKAMNRGSSPVLILDGEELAGAKQNRVLNTTILIKVYSEIVIPVSCTEQGRWTHQSEHFSDSGVMMASRFMATKECLIHDNIKQEIIRRQEFETTLICKSIGLQGRALKNKTVNDVLELEARSCRFEELLPLISGKRVKEAWETGDVDIAPMMVGQSIGLIRDIPTCKELMERMVAEAKADIKRVSGMC